MGKVNFSPIQELVFDELSKDPLLSKNFYFTGGSALSVFYLNHRYSDDLDFFSEESFGDEIIDDFIGRISKLVGASHRFTSIEKTRIFEFEKAGKLIIKIDFAHFPYPRLKEGKTYQGIRIDSLLDIAANKLLTINQRKNVKDYVDLFFLLKDFTVWDLLLAVEKKYQREIDLVLLAANLLIAEDFDYLPKMILPLEPSDLKKFFVEKGREIGSRLTKK